MCKTVIEDAIKLAGGSEAKLGALTGYSQAAINKAKKAGHVSAEMAVAIERGLSGQISRHDLRPDLWPASSAPPSATSTPCVSAASSSEVA